MQLLELDEKRGDGKTLRLADNIPTTEVVTQTPEGNLSQKPRAHYHRFMSRVLNTPPLPAF